jgi:cytochrome c-type biogenesis protein
MNLMGAYLLYAVAAAYLGVLTAISPCPLATNIAAISYVGRRVGSPRAVMSAGLLYTLGRCLLYVALAIVLAEVATANDAVARFLGSKMPLILGPIFLILGMFLVGLISTSIGGAVMTEGMRKRIDAMGIWGALALGVLFAVAFSPTSAVLYFGLIALILGSESVAVTDILANVGLVLPNASLTGSSIILPCIYGIATALPVILVAFLLAYSAQSIGKAFNIISKTERWARQITGWVFILGGIYFSLKFVF